MLLALDVHYHERGGARGVRAMAGEHRMPVLLRLVDRLCRDGAPATP